MTDDPVKAAQERLLKVEMQYPHALEGIASLYVWCKKLGVIGTSIWKIVVFFGVIIGAWIAMKQWLVDIATQGMQK